MCGCRIIASLAVGLLVLGGCASARPVADSSAAIAPAVVWISHGEAESHDAFRSAREEDAPVDDRRDAILIARRKWASPELLAGPPVDLESQRVVMSQSDAHAPMNLSVELAKPQSAPGTAKAAASRRRIFHLGAGDALGAAVFQRYVAWTRAQRAPHRIAGQQ